MKVKSSRNRQRKVLYAAQADKSSRNEAQIEAPVVPGARIEMVTFEPIVRMVEDSGGEKRPVVVDLRDVKPYYRVVHGPAKSVSQIDGSVTRKARTVFGRAAMRREEAAVRQAESDARSPAERIDRLNAMFGVGRGAKRERAKLAKLL